MAWRISRRGRSHRLLLGSELIIACFTCFTTMLAACTLELWQREEVRYGAIDGGLA